MSGPDMEGAGLGRYCALCLVPLEKILRCSKCQTRAYCSRECQKQDWVAGARKQGQGHKNWCGLQTGEEGVDWEVRRISDEKGLGLIALRTLEKGFRIMVDRCLRRPGDHPRVDDLEPTGGSRAEKFDLNAMGVVDDASVLCLRMSRANHACDNNAEHKYVDGVKVLHALREIKGGEEIMISYTTEGEDTCTTATNEMCRLKLKSKWGITCPKGCRCFDKDRARSFSEARKLDSLIFERFRRGDGKGALHAAESLLALLDLLNASPNVKARANFDAFQVAIMYRDTMTRALGFMRAAHALRVAVERPDSPQALLFQRYCDAPQTHPNYMTGR
ncbi:hypothetical protein T484DRAFT_1877558, partial [Baffinella frigidus]